MTVKELMNFLSKQNPEAKVTLTKDVAETYIDPDDGYGDDYLPLVSLDLFGDEMLDLVKYIKHNIGNVSNN